MTLLLLALALLGLLGWLSIPVLILVSGFRPRRLLDLPADGDLPTLTVIAPACNEEETVEPALRSLLAVDYPGLELIAVDDRSTDRTGAILDSITDPRLRVIHITDLPPGWLGKNHALHVAAAKATGEFILFTDADVRFEPSALRRALRFAVDGPFDHVCVFPDLELRGLLELATVGVFGTLYAIHTRFWAASRPGGAHIGIGAFNLVRASLYRSIGGHASLSMDVLDDVKLGRRLKLAGARVGIALGLDAVRVRWVSGVSGFVRGMTKNLFAAFRFSLPYALLGLVTVLLTCVWPVAGLFLGPWWTRAICGGSILVMVLSGAMTPTARGWRRINGLFMPLGGLVFCWTLLRSAAITLARGGVEWRGTHYPLKELRKGLV